MRVRRHRHHRDLLDPLAPHIRANSPRIRDRSRRLILDSRSRHTPDSHRIPRTLDNTHRLRTLEDRSNRRILDHNPNHPTRDSSRHTRDRDPRGSHPTQANPHHMYR